MAAVDLPHAQIAQDQLLAQVGDHPDVAGVGIGKDDEGYVLTVNVRRESASRSLPQEVDGVTVRFRTVGRVRKRNSV